VKGEEEYDKPFAVFAVSLQRVESILFIDTLYAAVRDAGYSCLPKHDSLIVDENRMDEVLKIIQAIMNGIGFKYHLKINGEIPANADRQDKIIPDSINQSPDLVDPVKGPEIEAPKIIKITPKTKGGRLLIKSRSSKKHDN
jgi:hypothetical protein